MRFCRCACLTAPELDKLEVAAKQEATTSTPQESRPAELLDETRSSLCSAGSDSKPASPSTVAAAQEAGCVHRSSAEATRAEGKSADGKAQCLVAETAVTSDNPPDHRSLPIEPKENIVRPDRRQRRQGGGRDGTEERTNSKDNGTSRERANETGGRGGGGGKDAAARETGRFPCKALSAQNEAAALSKAMDCFAQARDAFPTTLEHDEVRTADGVFKPTS